MWTVIVRDATGNIHSKTQLKTGVISIGRGSDCDIVLPSAAVSRLHARLLVGGGATLIYSDERSANGSFIDGQPVLGVVDVGEGSTIGVGDFRISLEREGSTSAQSKGMTSTLIFSPKDVQLIAQAPPKAAPAVSAKPPESAKQDMAKTVIGQPKSALPGFEFKDLDALFSKPMEQAPPATLSASITHLLDQQIRGIQSHRSTQQATARTRVQEVEQQWQDALVAARDLQSKLHGNPRVMYFVIARDESEISIKLTDTSKRGYANLILSKRHPETGKISEGVVWFGMFGEEAQAYREPREALEDFVRRIAAKLA